MRSFTASLQLMFPFIQINQKTTEFYGQCTMIMHEIISDDAPCGHSKIRLMDKKGPDCVEIITGLNSRIPRSLSIHGLSFCS